MPTSSTTTSTSSARGAVVTTEGIRQWIAPGAVIISLVAYIVYLSASLSAVQSRVASLEEERVTRNDVRLVEARLTRVEQERISDHELLMRIDRKLALLICKTDPAHCDAQ